MEIMRLLPVGKDYLWGGTRLRSEYGKDIRMTPLAETWECSVHPDGPSTVANGQYKNMLLSDVLEMHPEYLGTKVKDGKLPILVKFIDAEKDLSIQVHPDDEYARTHEGQNGKTEFWYVIDADENASLIYGFKHRTDKNILQHALETKSLEKHLNRVKVHKGDCFFVPAGTVHGIGAGTLLAEVQESSNITYRIYDYDRIDKNGKKRELHLDKATEVMNPEPSATRPYLPRVISYRSGACKEKLCRCKYFDVERIQATKGFAFSVLESSFQILMCLEGEGEIETMDIDSKPLRLKKGETLFLPAGMGKCVLFGEAELLKIRC